MEEYVLGSDNSSKALHSVFLTLTREPFLPNERLFVPNFLLERKGKVWVSVLYVCSLKKQWVNILVCATLLNDVVHLVINYMAGSAQSCTRGKTAPWRRRIRYYWP